MTPHAVYLIPSLMPQGGFLHRFSSSFARVLNPQLGQPDWLWWTLAGPHLLTNLCLTSVKQPSGLYFPCCGSHCRSQKPWTKGMEEMCLCVCTYGVTGEGESKEKPDPESMNREALAFWERCKMVRREESESYPSFWWTNGMVKDD